MTLLPEVLPSTTTVNLNGGVSPEPGEKMIETSSDWPGSSALLVLPSPRVGMTTTTTGRLMAAAARQTRARRTRPRSAS